MTLAAGFFVVFVLGGLLGAYVHSLIRPTDQTETTPLPDVPFQCRVCGVPVKYRTHNGRWLCSKHKVGDAA